jgi:hypothetical protein
MSGGDPHPCRYTEPVPGTSAADVRERLVQLALVCVRELLNYLPFASDDSEESRRQHLSHEVFAQARDLDLIKSIDGQDWLGAYEPRWVAGDEVAALIPKPLEVRMAEALANGGSISIAEGFAAEARAALEAGRWKDVQP